MEPSVESNGVGGGSLDGPELVIFFERWLMCDIDQRPYGPVPSAFMLGEVPEATGARPSRVHLSPVEKVDKRVGTGDNDLLGRNELREHKI